MHGGFLSRTSEGEKGTFSTHTTHHALERVATGVGDIFPCTGYAGFTGLGGSVKIVGMVWHGWLNHNDRLACPGGEKGVNRWGPLPGDTTA